MKIKFTPTEREIILHRLGVPDAIADALEEDFNSNQFPITDTIQRLYAQFKNGEVWDTEEATDLEKAIIKDCCDGSTYFAGSEDAVNRGEWSRGKLHAHQTAAYSIELKLKAAGIEVNIPWN